MIIYGTYLTGMVGKRKCQDPITPNQIKVTQTKFKKNFPGYWSPPESVMEKMEDL